MSNLEISVHENIFQELDLDTLVREGSASYKQGYENAIDPISIAIIVGGALALSKLIVSIRNEARGGVVIDSTETPPIIRRDRELPYGHFVIITPDGTVELETRDEPRDSIERVLTSLIEAFSSQDQNNAEDLKTILDQGRKAIENPE